MKPLEELEKRREELLKQIGNLGDMRRGTLLERYIPCGKKGCHCTKPDSKGHGPKYSLTHKVKNKTETKYIPPEQYEEVREQTENHKRFTKLCQEFLKVNEDICSLRLEEGTRGESDSKKNFAGKSKKKSRRKSSVF
jgi:hypothetical protein